MLRLKLQYLGPRCEEPTHWKRPWCWERLKEGEGDNRGDGWMAAPMWWTWVWAGSRSWLTGKPCHADGMLQSMGSQGVGHKWATELNWRIFLFHYGYWGQFHVIYSRILLLIHSLYNSLHLLSSNSQSAPPLPLPPWQPQTRPLCLWVCFYFIDKLTCVTFQIPYISGIIWCLSLSDGLHLVSTPSSQIPMQ